MRGKLYYKPIKLKRSLSMRVEELVSEYLINGYDVIVDNDNELDTKEEWKEHACKLIDTLYVDGVLARTVWAIKQ